MSLPLSQHVLMASLLLRFRGASIAGVEEYVEQTFGEAVQARDLATAHCAREGGLGPPDLCWIRKARADGRGQPEGSYHWVLGADVSSPVCSVLSVLFSAGGLLTRSTTPQASIAAYFAQLLTRVQQPQGVSRYLTAATDVQGGIFCCYDAFNRVDVRCELTFPGGLSCCAAHEGDGEPRELGEDDWRSVRLSAALRALRASPAVLLRCGCVRRVGEVPASPAAEAALLEDALAQRSRPDALAQAAALAGRGPGLPPESRRHWARAPQQDVLLETLLAHFLASKRAAAGAQFLRRAVGAGALAGALAAQCEWGEALAAVRSALEPHAGAEPPGEAHISLRLWLVKLHLGCGDVQAACACAREACALAPAVRACWLLLGASLARCESWEECLVALNCAHHVERAEEEEADAWLAAFPQPHPQPARRTCASPLCVAVEEEALRREEAVELEGRARLQALPAAQLLPSPSALYYCAGGGEGAPPLTPAQRAAGAAFETLVEVVGALGWEGFLQLRARVFLMDEPAPEPEREQEGAQRAPLPAATAAAAAMEQESAGRRVGTREAGARAAGAPPPGSLAGAPAESPARACEAASPLGVGAVRGACAADEVPGDAAVQRDRLALAAAEPLPPPRLCAAWLDGMVGALYEDVCEYSAWRSAEAAEAEAARGGGDAAAAAAADSDAALGTQGDWMRRGALCERLKRADDAERAYRVCVHLGFNLTAWGALARIYAAWGWAPETLTACGQLAEALGGEGRGVPPSLALPLRHLIATVGLQAARDAQAVLGEAHAAINQVFHETVRWRSAGWDA